MWEADLICCVYSCCCVRELGTHISVLCTQLRSLYSGISTLYPWILDLSLRLSWKISVWVVTQRLILHVIWFLLPPVRFSQIRCFYAWVKVMKTAGVAGCLLCLSHSLCQYMNFGPFLRQTDSQRWGKFLRAFRVKGFFVFFFFIKKTACWFVSLEQKKRIVKKH